MFTLLAFLVPVIAIADGSETTPMPEITVQEFDEYVTITAVGEGDVRLFILDEEVSNPYYAQREDEDYSLYVHATAQAEGCLPATTNIFEIVVPAIEIPEPTEITETPVINLEMINYDPPTALVTICPTEEGCYLYYCYLIDGDGDGEWEVESDYFEYTGPLMFNAVGRYQVHAYAIVPGKQQSYFSILEFYLTEPVPAQDYDFEVDGIYYDYIDGNKVSVVECPLVSGYVGDIVIPSTVSYNNDTYRVTAIGENAFENCQDVTSVSIGAYVTTIGEAAFKNCTGLTEVTLGDYVINVDREAFSGCSALTSLTIGHGVRNIGSKAFAGCTALEAITCKPATPPTTTFQNCFDCYQTATLKVFPAVIDTYQSTNYWNRFANIVGEDTVNPEPNDIDGDGNFGINDITTLIDRLLGN